MKIVWVILALTVAVTVRIQTTKHANPCTVNEGDCMSIQGKYSKEDCPGQSPWYIEVDGHKFFMGCRDVGS